MDPGACAYGTDMAAATAMSRLPSAGKLRRLNRRQRKKLRVGEFREYVFEVSLAFRHPLDEVAHVALLDDFIAMIESLGLVVGGLGGRLPLMRTDGVIAARGRGSPSAADRHAVLEWLTHRPEVARVQAGELVDGWYGWDDEVPNAQTRAAMDEARTMMNIRASGSSASSSNADGE